MNHKLVPSIIAYVCAVLCFMLATDSITIGLIVLGVSCLIFAVANLLYHYA